ncbi:MAG TPA: ATP-dependent DNA ligase [Candidatus Limnocylindria bacterium]|nr:ATP-dependent DNA ligase [Candidatus Limnocylindria bacterium]
MSGPFADWVSTADAVRATTKKLEKLALLGRYFQRLDDADLAIAARLYAGVPFPRTDERVLAVGWAALLDAVVARSGASGDDIAASYQRHADLGDVAAELTERSASPAKPPALTLGDVAEAFDRVAATRGVAPKGELLVALLARASAAEVRYLVKVMSGEPRIGLREGLLEDAIARTFGRDREAVGRAHMLGGDIGMTAVRAKNDRLGEARFVHFAPIGMMLATPVLDLVEVEKRFPPPYVVDDKYDGVRAQVHKEGDRVELYSRTFDRVTSRFPELIEPLLAIPGTFVLDAEVLAFDPAGRAIPFTAFQTRLGRKVVSEELRRDLPATLVVFDVLERDGRPLLDEPLAERQRVLATLPLRPPLTLARSSEIRESGDALVAALDALFTASRERGNEGLVVKDPRSPYRPGRRGMEWLKVKRALRTLDVVVTAVEWGHGKRRGVLSDYTFAVRDGDRYLNVGKAYSGLTDSEIAEMTEYFKAHTVKDFGRTRLVVPDTVIEVAFDQVQKSARHTSGYALRFPRIVRLRPDKPVGEIDTLATVRSIAEPDTGGG